MGEFRHEGLRGGIWRGVILGREDPGPLAIVHLGETVGHAAVTALPGGAGWQVVATLPLDRMVDGATSFHLVEAPGEGRELEPGARRIATLPVAAGAPVEADLRAEIGLLRAEIELLKREFRRQAGADRSQFTAALASGDEAGRLMAEARDAIDAARRHADEAGERAERAARDLRERVEAAEREAREARERADRAGHEAWEARERGESAANELRERLETTERETRERGERAEQEAGEARQRADEAAQLAHGTREGADGLRDRLEAVERTAHEARDTLPDVTVELRGRVAAVERIATERADAADRAVSSAHDLIEALRLRIEEYRKAAPVQRDRSVSTSPPQPAPAGRPAPTDGPFAVLAKPGTSPQRPVGPPGAGPFNPKK